MKKVIATFGLLTIMWNVQAQFDTVMVFDGVSGRNPKGGLISDGTYLYGMTVYGSANDRGDIFKIKPNGTGYQKLHSFDATGTNGNAPSGRLLLEGDSLYGMTQKGGANNLGTVFKIHKDGTGFKKIADFSTATGRYPGGNPGFLPEGDGSLVSDGTFLYGMTYEGGTATSGNIFKLKRDGTSFQSIFSFANTSGATSTGKNPYGSLVSDGTYLYGMTYNGGQDGYGVVFRIKTDGTDYKKTHEFLFAENGKPKGSLLLHDGLLYGATEFSNGGAGSVFKLKPDGTDYKMLFSFVKTESKGNTPWASLVTDGTYLYGVTKFTKDGAGGGSGSGTVFKVKLDGTGFGVLAVFDQINIAQPNCPLVFQGDQLYGMAYLGTAGRQISGSGLGYGLIYKIGKNATTAVESKTEVDQWMIYPNPAQNVLNLSNLPTASTITVFDITGRQMYKNIAQASTVTIDTEGFPCGDYVIHTASKEGSSVKKIVIMR